jgi:hypothetical protein
MTRGFDHLNRFFTLVEPPHAGRPTPYAFPEGEVARWGSVSAGRLAFGRWLQPDARPWRDQPAPAASLDSATRKVRVRSDLGLRAVGINGGHWQVENRSHWVRDVTFGEDACQVRTGKLA